MKIPKDFQRVSTSVQASFHLDRGSSLVMFGDDSSNVIITKNQETEDSYDLFLVPPVGKSKIFEGNLDAVYAMVEEYPFYATEQSILVEKKPSLLDKVVDWVSRR